MIGAIMALAPGERITYHVGHLAFDKMGNPDIEAASRAAMEQFRSGLAALVQRRVGPEKWEYIAVGLQPRRRQ